MKNLSLLFFHFLFPTFVNSYIRVYIISLMYHRTQSLFFSNINFADMISRTPSEPVQTFPDHFHYHLWQYIAVSKCSDAPISAISLIVAILNHLISLMPNEGDFNRYSI